MLYKSVIRPLLFKLEPEKAHHFTFNSIKIAFRVPGISSLARLLFTYEDKKLERTVFGLTFKNPVGLAAGFDKDARLFNELACFGFGFIEIGTLTPKAQPGNDKPRMFRLPEDQALINRMGFNNGGVEEAVERLRKNYSGILIGGNIGKNKLTDNSEAINDYEICFHALYEFVDYFVVNVSSPNTPGLRELQEKEPLTRLLNKMQELNSRKAKKKPVLLKIAPDLTDQQLEDIICIVKETGIAGIIATNTTISREGLSVSKDRLSAIGAGGLSGAPLKDRSTEVVRFLHQKSNGSIPIIAVGGIYTAQDVKEKLAAGASLVQVYTGFIYEGPAMIKNILKGL